MTLKSPSMICCSHQWVELDCRGTKLSPLPWQICSAKRLSGHAEMDGSSQPVSGVTSWNGQLRQAQLLWEEDRAQLSCWLGFRHIKAGPARVSGATSAWVSLRLELLSPCQGMWLCFAETRLLWAEREAVNGDPGLLSLACLCWYPNLPEVLLASVVAFIRGSNVTD